MHQWLVTNCPSITSERAETYSQRFYTSTYDTTLKVAKKLLRSGTDWLTEDLKFDVLDADDILAAMRREGLLPEDAPATVEYPVATLPQQPSKSRQRQTSLDNATDVSDSTPQLTPAQLKIKEDDEALSKWLQLNCGSVYPEDAMEYTQRLRAHNAGNVDRIAKKIRLLAQAEGRRHRARGSGDGDGDADGVAASQVGVWWLRDEVQLDEAHAFELVLALTTCGLVDDPTDRVISASTRAADASGTLASTSAAGTGIGGMARLTREEQKKALAGSFSAPEVRQLATAALLTPAPTAPGHDAGTVARQTVTLVTPGLVSAEPESMLERRFKSSTMPASRALPAAIPLTAAAGAMPATVPRDIVCTGLVVSQSAPVLTTGAAVSAAPPGTSPFVTSDRQQSEQPAEREVALSPLAACEQASSSLKALLALAPPISLTPAASSSSAFDWSVSSIRRAQAYGQSAQAVFKALCASVATGSQAVLLRTGVLGGCEDVVELLKRCVTFGDEVAAPRWMELQSGAGADGQDPEVVAVVGRLMTAYKDALHHGCRAVRLLAVDAQHTVALVQGRWSRGPCWSPSGSASWARCARRRQLHWASWRTGRWTTRARCCYRRQTAVRA